MFLTIPIFWLLKKGDKRSKYIWIWICVALEIAVVTGSAVNSFVLASSEYAQICSEDYLEAFPDLYLNDAKITFVWMDLHGSFITLVIISSLEAILAGRSRPKDELIATPA